MKTKQILILIAFFVGTLGMYAQTTLTSVIEKRIGDTVYLLDTVNYILSNKMNNIIFQEYLGDCLPSLDNSTNAGLAWKAHFKPLFSEERAEKLKVMISIKCICDSTGLIREIEIFFKNRENFEIFTLSEIKAIENTAKTYRYKFNSWSRCEEQKYVHVFHPFSPYLLYFEKPK